MTSTLTFHVFTKPERPLAGEQVRPFGPPLAWDPQTSTLIDDGTDTVLVDVFPAISEARQLVDWVAQHGRNLVAIYITHGHIDHFAGLPVLLDAFPEARVIATPACAAAMRSQLDAYDMFDSIFDGELPDADDIKAAIPEPFTGEEFQLGGHDLRIIAQGYTDAPDSTSLYVPDLDLVVAGDVVYTECHMFLGATTPESRQNWLVALDRLAALNPRHVVAGHKKPGSPDPASSITASREYIETYDDLRSSTETDEQFYNAMIGAYPDHAGPQPWLMFGFR